jgi:hypothetical protein
MSSVADETAKASSTPRPATRGQIGPWIAWGLLAYACTATLVMAGVWCGVQVVPPGGAARSIFERSAERAMSGMDGRWYARLLRSGYDQPYHRELHPAFFPLYPLVGRAVAGATGGNAEESLIVVSHACLLVSFVLLGVYAAGRGLSEVEARWTVVAFALLPPGFFFRMAYSEALFLLLLLTAMLAVLAGKRPLLVAFIAGLATATRPVGVAMLPVVALYAWRRETASLLRRALAAALLTGVGGLGLLAYMAYLQASLSDALAFAHAQRGWNARPVAPLSEKAAALLRFEPVWSVYVPSSPCYCEKQDHLHPLVSLQAANPAYYVGAWVLVAVGCRRRWLSPEETLLCTGLLTIPYLSRAFEMCLSSHARFASVAFPVYLVLGRLAASSPFAVRVVAVLAAAGYLFVYSLLFAAGYVLI